MPKENSPHSQVIKYFLAIVAIIGSMELLELYFNNRDSIELVNNTTIKDSAVAGSLDSRYPDLLKKSDTDSLDFEVEDSIVLKIDTVKMIQNDVVDVSIDSSTRLIKAYQKEILARNINQRSRQDIVIRYYTKVKDEGRVDQLHDLGFYIHERPSSGSEKYRSNVLHYGDSVLRKDLFLIAYTLIENGIDLQDISLSKFHDTWKAHSIEIGTDTTLFGKPVISLSSLELDWKSE